MEGNEGEERGLCLWEKGVGAGVGARGMSLMCWAGERAGSGPGQVHGGRDTPFTCGLPPETLLRAGNLVSPLPARLLSPSVFSSACTPTPHPVLTLTFYRHPEIQLEFR